MQRCSIWTVSLAAALSLTGTAWAEHGEGGHGPAGGHGTTPTFAKQRESDGAHEARESHSRAQNSGTRSAAGANFAARLANNPTLSARLLALLQPTGFCASTCTKTDLMTAATGFRNQGQFIAALHVADNLKLTAMQFKNLLAEMTGKGEDKNHDSLGQALHEVDTALDAQTIKTDVTLARQEAKTDLQAARAAKEAAEDTKEAAKEKAEDAKEAAKEKAEDAKEAEEGGANFAARLTARLAKDPTLAATLSGLLPMGTNMQTAAMGFRNLNQFLTALNAAKDLHLDFGMLQKAMTGPGHDSLAQAILDQKPTLDATMLKTAIMTARNETKADLKAVRAAEDAAEDAKEAAKEAAEDAKEATKEATEDAREAAEEANEAAKAPTGTTTTGSSPTPSSVTKP
jgi:hypothetical protein